MSWLKGTHLVSDCTGELDDFELDSLSEIFVSWIDHENLDDTFIEEDPDDAFYSSGLAIDYFNDVVFYIEGGFLEDEPMKRCIKACVPLPLMEISLTAQYPAWDLP